MDAEVRGQIGPSGGYASRTASRAIPPILHQTWMTKRLPAPLARLAATWRHHHPGWELRLYDDEEARALVSRARPDALALYDALPLPVQRADLFRCIALLAEGGVYADIDMECLRPFDRFLDSAALTLSAEASLDRRRARELGYRYPLQLANCIMAAPPGDRFLAAFVDDMLADGARLKAARHAEVEDTTGPRRLTRLFYARQPPAVRVLRQIVWMAPLEYPPRLIPAIHARHRCLGSWKLPERIGWRERWLRRNRLPAPFPVRLEQTFPWDRDA